MAQVARFQHQAEHPCTAMPLIKEMVHPLSLDFGNQRGRMTQKTKQKLHCAGPKVRPTKRRRREFILRSVEGEKEIKKEKEKRTGEGRGGEERE